MRIISGRFKGRTLKAPDNRATRPTADRTRETLFNILAHAEWGPEFEGARVIDLFAGSGALGFEAISRGAAFCLFVETDFAARGAIRENAEVLGLLGTTRIHRRSALDLGAKPAGLGTPFDLAFLDPPYGQGLGGPAVTQLSAGGWIALGALIVLEQGAGEAVPEACEQVASVLAVRETGPAQLVFLRHDGGASQTPATP
jgi:16S rRNA (guanine966-N2)-methyltransferase